MDSSPGSFSEGSDQPFDESFAHDESFAAVTPPRRYKSAWTVTKWLLTVLVVAFVISRAASLWHDGATEKVRLHAGWLLFAGFLYTAGWLPSVWFWKLLMARMGDEIGWPAAFRAYYCGHLGKYVPGKALVPVIRGQLAAQAGGRFRAGALAAVYETLMMMGVGGVISVGLALFLVPDDVSQLPARLQQLTASPTVRWAIHHSWSLAGALLIGTLASIPVISRLFALIARKLALVDSDGRLTRSIDARAIGTGIVAACAAWSIHGLALWATLRGVGVPVSAGEIPVWTAGVSLPTVAGFFAIFSPGGVGVREGLLIEVLKWHPLVDSRQAVAAALTLRIVGLAAEVVVSVVLYYGLNVHPHSSESALTTESPAG